jgi:hypothetical protein
MHHQVASTRTEPLSPSSRPAQTTLSSLPLPRPSAPPLPRAAPAPLHPRAPPPPAPHLSSLAAGAEGAAEGGDAPSTTEPLRPQKPKSPAKHIPSAPRPACCATLPAGYPYPGVPAVILDTNGQLVPADKKRVTATLCTCGAPGARPNNLGCSVKPQPYLRVATEPGC